ncbi:MAG: hypothetical protein AB7O44_30325 [Hyphomicrobiaceae bacterium]
MSLVIDPFTLFGGLKELARDTSFYTATPNSSTPSSDARSIGAASPTRRVFALLAWWHGSNNRTLSSATIGGVTATIHIQTTDSVRARVAIIWADVPTGTTAVIACTFDGAVAFFAAAVIALDGLKSGTPVDSDQSSIFVSVNIDTDLGGYVMAISQSSHAGTATSASWTFLTEGIEIDLNDGSNNFVVTMAYKANVADLTGQAIATNFALSTSGSIVCVSVL